MKKFLLTIFSFVLMISVVNASDPKFIWEKTWGEGQNVRETFIAVDSYDDVHYAVGVKTSYDIYTGGMKKYNEPESSKDRNLKFSNSSDQFFKDAVDYYYGVVVKYDKDGNMLWERVNHNAYVFYQVKATSDGGVLVLGDYNGDNDNSSNSYTALTKYDSKGNIEWNSSLGDRYNSQTPFNTTSIEVTSDGNIILMAGYDNRFIFKFDSKGNEIWYKEYEDVSTDNEYTHYYDSFVDKNDNIVAIGYTDLYSTDGNGNSTLTNYYKSILKYDVNGYIKFNKRIEITSNVDSYYLAINQDLEGNYVLLSKTEVYDDNSENITDAYFAFEIFDENGNYKETKKISSYSYDDEVYYYKLLIDKSGNYIINYYGIFNMISKKFDKDGNVIWKNTGDFKNALLDLDIDEYNNYIYVGGVAEESRPSSSGSEILSVIALNELSKKYYLVDAYIEKFSTDYMINKETEGEGTVEVNLDNAKAGEEVTIEAKAASGYRIDKIIVTDKDGNIIKVSGNKFVMPNSDVTVKAIFTNSPLVNPKTGAISITFAVIAISVYAFFQYKYIKTKEMSL